MTSGKVILMVSDEGAGNHGEVHVLDTAEDAERMIETLLEADCEQAKIRVLTGAPVDFATSYRPVVTFTSEASAEPPHRESAAIGRPGPEPALVEAGIAVGEADADSEDPPRRLSHLFRSA